MLEFLKQQEILHKQDMEKFQKQRQEDLERFSQLLEPLFLKKRKWSSQLLYLSSGSRNQLDCWIRI